jgi:UDP-glucuronate 4-epimerase
MPAAIIEGTPARLLNHGHMRCDFSHFDDVIPVVFRLVPHSLLCGEGVGSPCGKGYVADTAGEGIETFGRVGDLTRDVGFGACTSIEDRMSDFVACYRDHYKV